MRNLHRLTKVAVLVATILAALACNYTGRTTPTPTPVVIAPEETGDVTSTAPPTQAPQDTPVPDVTTEAGCSLNAAFVEDITVPDRTEFSPGASFTKTWRLRNSGTCDWESGTRLVHISGDRMDAPDSVPVPAAAAGATTDVSVDLIAPDEPGTYKGNWQMEASDGTRFGSVVYVEIVVPELATETPTATATPTPTPTRTPPSGDCVDVDPRLESIFDEMDDEGYDPGCATADAFLAEGPKGTGALQEFWRNIDDSDPDNDLRSLAVWRGDNEEIYFIVGEDRRASEGVIMAYTDFWTESQPEVHPDCEDMTPPSGYQLPIRGIGKIWCENELWEVIGWPKMHEEVATLLLQPTEMGLLMKASTPSRTYLIAMHYRAVWAVTSRP